MKTKQCSKCKTVKTLNNENFYQRKDGYYQSWCQACYKTPEMNEYRNERIKQWKKENPEKWKAYFSNWRKNNKEKCKQLVYKWMENNIDSMVDIQKKYQSKVAGGIYCIKYKGDIVYVGSTNQPLRRINVHFSTITTCNNIGKINRLHSFLGYDKKDFSWNMLETCDDDTMIEREKYYRQFHKSKENYKRIFGKIPTTKKLIEKLGLITKPRNKWRK